MSRYCCCFAVEEVDHDLTDICGQCVVDGLAEVFKQFIKERRQLLLDNLDLFDHFLHLHNFLFLLHCAHKFPKLLVCAFSFLLGLLLAFLSSLLPFLCCLFALFSFLLLVFLNFIFLLFLFFLFFLVVIVVDFLFDFLLDTVRHLLLHDHHPVLGQEVLLDF